MAKRGRKRSNHQPLMPVTTPRHVEPEAAQAQPVAGGPTTAYRDGEDGKVEVLDCPDGRIPKGWHDTPAKCDNCDGKTHPEYVKVKLD